MQELITLMDKVKTSGAFSVSGTLPSIPPGLEVKGVGNIGLPLTEHQAKALIELIHKSDEFLHGYAPVGYSMVEDDT